MRRRRPRLTPDQKAGKEARLASFVVAWLEDHGWDVYQEVKYGFSEMGAGDAVADIVAVKDGVVWIIECKTSLNLTAMMQVYRHPSQRHGDPGPYIFQLSSYERRFGYQCLAEFCQAGVLEVSSEGKVTEVRAAPPRSADLAPLLIAQLRPEHKTFAKAGERGGGYWTPYKETIGKVRALITERGLAGITLREIIQALGKCHYSSERSARQQIKNALEGWEADWCRAGAAHEERDGVARYYIRV